MSSVTSRSHSTWPFPGSSGRRGSRTDDGIPRHSAGPTAGGCWIGAAGRLPQELAAAGLAPDEVELVFLTHLHLDHVSWNLAWDGDQPRPRFPRARYLIQRADWELFASQGDDNDREAFERCVRPLQALGVVELLDGGHVLGPELTVVHTPGHTPGSQSLLVRSGGDAALLGRCRQPPGPGRRARLGPA
jgi:glyoxylase-like metal-dependent hydrolase (beta-lactamase superfamily II)